jgi:hypothetical protein
MPSTGRVIVRPAAGGWALSGALVSGGASTESGLGATSGVLFSVIICLEILLVSETERTPPVFPSAPIGTADPPRPRRTPERLALHRRRQPLHCAISGRRRSLGRIGTIRVHRRVPEIYPSLSIAS